jgi:hypothetical protein
MTAREIALRPVRLRTWKELAYLLTGLPVGIVTFTVVVTGVVTGVSLLVTLVGIPVLVATAYADRALAWVERRRAALVLGRPIADPVPRRPDRPGALAWLKALALDHQTWKDAAWMILLFVVGLVGFVVAVVLWAVALWAVTFPLYWWALPHDALPQIAGDGDEFVPTRGRSRSRSGWPGSRCSESRRGCAPFSPAARDCSRALSWGRASARSSSAGSASSRGRARPPSTPRRASCAGSSATSTTGHRRAWWR